MTCKNCGSDQIIYSSPGRGYCLQCGEFTQIPRETDNYQRRETPIDREPALGAC